MVKIIIHNIVPWKMPVSRKWWILCWEQLIPIQSTKRNKSFNDLLFHYGILIIKRSRAHSSELLLATASAHKHSLFWTRLRFFFKMTRDRTTWGFLCSWCIRTAGCMRRTRWWTFCLRSAWPPQSSRPLLPPSEKPRDKTRTNR